jgi:hypothetical protein
MRFVFQHGRDPQVGLKPLGPIELEEAGARSPAQAAASSVVRQGGVRVRRKTALNAMREMGCTRHPEIVGDVRGEGEASRLSTTLGARCSDGWTPADEWPNSRRCSNHGRRHRPERPERGCDRAPSRPRRRPWQATRPILTART